MDIGFKLIWLVLIASILNSPQALGLSSDYRQPIKIESDTATIDDVQGIAIYQGNVVVTQGTIRINAAKVTLNYTTQQTLDKVIAEGNPVKFKQRPDKGDDDLHAHAQRMEYYADQDMLHLRYKAKVWKGEDSVVGKQIRYNTRTGIVNADSGNGANDRVIVTIVPRKKTD